MKDITMRRITPEDVPALSVMSKETFFDTFTGTCTPEDMEDFLEKYYNENTLLHEQKPELNFILAKSTGSLLVIYLLKKNCRSSRK